MFRFLLLMALCLAARMLPAQPLPKLIPYKAKSGWGYCDSNKVMRIPTQFSSAGLFYGGKALVTFGEANETFYCVLDEAGRYIIPPAYHWGGPYILWEGRYAALNAHDSSGRLGMIDTAGNVLFPFVYDPSPLDQSSEYRFQFHKYPGYPQPFLVVGKDGKQGVIDTLGNTLLPFKYEAIAPSKRINATWRDDSVFAWVIRLGAKYGALRFDGQPLFPPLYDTIYPVHMMPWAIVRVRGRMGVVDTSGRAVVPLIYDSVVFNGYYGTTGFQTRLGNRWGWHDAVTGKAVKPAYQRTDYPYGAYGYIVVRDTSDKSQYEKMLLNADGRLLTRLPYDDVRLYRDSVVVTKYMGKTYASVLDKKTWKPGAWHEASKDFGIIVEAPPSPAIYIQRPGEFSIYKDGKQIKSFSKDSLQWTVCGYATGDKVNGTLDRLYIVKSYHSPSQYAVVDSNFSYRILPQTSYEITGGDFFANRIFVRTNGRYGVTDTAFRPVTRLIERKFTDYFRWKGDDYFFGEWQAGQPVVERKDSWDCFRCNCTTLLNSRGNIAKGFRPYCRVGLTVSYSTRAYVGSYDTLTATDSLGRVGLVSPKGSIYYPKVSFKYPSMNACSDRVFYVVTTQDGHEIVDADNQPYLPKLRISHTNMATSHPFLKDGKYSDVPGLFYISYYINRTDRSEIFIDRHGTIYADADALQ